MTRATADWPLTDPIWRSAKRLPVFRIFAGVVFLGIEIQHGLFGYFRCGSPLWGISLAKSSAIQAIRWGFLGHFVVGIASAFAISSP